MKPYNALFDFVRYQVSAKIVKMRAEHGFLFLPCSAMLLAWASPRTPITLL